MRKLLWIGCIVLSGCAASGERPLQLVSSTPVAYPAEARSAGLEGYVVVRYDVTDEGLVTNAQVIESRPAGTFDAAALAAVATWRYRPREVDGKPAGVLGMTSRLTFKLGDGSAYSDY
ncbi:MAG: TonB family protein [Pseudomonadales bacterium]